MIIKRKYVALGPGPLKYKITRGCCYDVDIEMEQISHDAFFEKKFHFIDDDGEKTWCGGPWLNDHFVIVSEWREMQLLELGIQ
jgi:hypothetical protein